MGCHRDGRKTHSYLFTSSTQSDFLFMRLHSVSLFSSAVRKIALPHTTKRSFKRQSAPKRDSTRERNNGVDASLTHFSPCTLGSYRFQHQRSVREMYISIMQVLHFRSFWPNSGERGITGGGATKLVWFPRCEICGREKNAAAVSVRRDIEIELE